MRVLRKILKEPLLHFMAAGAALFVLFEVVSLDEPADIGENVIRIDRAALLTFIQYRSRAFKPEIAATRLNAMSEVERRRLIDDYVREEALHRKSISLGMGANDYIIKRRLIQKVEFLARGFADAATSLDEKDVKAYFEANKKDYYVQPWVTFTHIFFDTKKRGNEAAQTAAAEKLKRLNKDSVPFTDAPRYGDRFPYHLNYVERTPDYVASHVGPDMARAVFALKAGDGVWRGPYRSPYGLHLVLVSKSEPGRIPAWEEVRRRVTDDARRAGAREQMEASIREIVGSYEVRISDDLPSFARVLSARAAE